MMFVITSSLSKVESKKKERQLHAVILVVHFAPSDPNLTICYPLVENNAFKSSFSNRSYRTERCRPSSDRQSNGWS